MKIKRLTITVLSAILAALPLSAQQEILTVEIGERSITHILFTSDLTYVNIASPSIIKAKVVESSKNMLAMQAVGEFAYQTTVSALEANGTMHTFYVRYNSSPTSLLIDTRVNAQSGGGQVNTQIRPDQGQAQGGYSSYPVQTTVVESTSGGSTIPDYSSTRHQQNSYVPPSQRRGGNRNNGQNRQQQNNNSSTTGVNVTSTQTSNFGRGNAPTIEEVMRKSRNLYHITDKSFGMEADCINIYAYSDLTYIVISLTNKSDIGYDAGEAQFMVESKKTSSRSLATDKSIWPKSSFGKLACAPNSMTKIGYTIPKLTLQKNEVLKIYIYEKDGTRNLFLTLDANDINYAVSPLQ